MLRETTENPRWATLDAWRGMLMILMALDHAAYFVGKRGPNEIWNLPLPDYPNALAFLTRYATHLCAPGFSLLLGISLVLYANSRVRHGWSHSKISLQLLKRGLALIVLEQLLDGTAWIVGERFASVPIDGYREIKPANTEAGLFLGVLFDLGCSTIAGGLLLRLSNLSLLLLPMGLLTISHSFIVFMRAEEIPVSIGLHLLFIPGSSGFLDVSYPIAPWLSLASLGIVLGRLLVRDAAKVYRIAPWVGAGLIAAFIWLRGHGMGDVNPAIGTDWIDFMRVTKYPPSPAYLCLTVGANLLLLGLFGWLAKAPEPLLALGRTALFFYFAHLWFFCLFGIIFPSGLPLPWVYVVWFLGLLPLYPLCLAYARFKRGKPLDSVWRML